MTASKRRTWANGFLIAALLYFPAAHAQLGNLLNQNGNSGGAGGLGSLSGLAGGSSLQSHQAARATSPACSSSVSRTTISTLAHHRLKTA
jgi:hypothetical protein